MMGSPIQYMHCVWHVCTPRSHHISLPNWILDEILSPVNFRPEYGPWTYDEDTRAVLALALRATC